MPNFIAFDGKSWSIPNETTQGENFAEKWNADPARAHAFFEWHQACVRDLEDLLELVGRDRIQKRLAEAFGPAAAARAMQPMTDRMSTARTSGHLTVTPGLGLSSTTGFGAGTVVRPNTFYGAP
jgi:hypothetical protein